MTTAFTTPTYTCPGNSCQLVLPVFFSGILCKGCIRVHPLWMFVMAAPLLLGREMPWVWGGFAFLSGNPRCTIPFGHSTQLDIQMGHLQMISDDLSIKHVDVPLLFEIAWVTQLQFNSLCYYDKGLEQYHVDLSDA